MDTNNLKEISIRGNDSKLPQRVKDELYTDLRDFVLRGEPLSYHPFSKEELQEVLAIMGLAEGVTKEQIAFMKVYGTIDDDNKTYTDEDFTGKVAIEDLLLYLPDRRWIFEQNINDYIVSVVVQLDETSLLIVSEEQKEYELTCSDCDDYDEGECPNSHPYEYTQENWIMLVQPKDLDKVDWSSGEIW